MNQVAVQDDLSRNMIEIENTQRMCALLMKTPHYAKMGAEGIYAIVSKSKALGMNTMDALNGALYFVNGKVGMPAETMAALIRQKGHSIIKDSKSNDNVCILHGKRADNGDTWTISFSMEDALKAGLKKNMYDKYPSAMLYNRAMSFLARQLFPDLIKGAGYTLDELKEIAENSPLPIGESEVVEEKKPQLTFDQVEELVALLRECGDEYYMKVFEAIRKPPISLEGFENLPLALYERIKNAALKKREEVSEAQEFVAIGE